MKSSHIEYCINDDADVVLTCCRASIKEVLAGTPPSGNGSFLVKLSQVPLAVQEMEDKVGRSDM